MADYSRYRPSYPNEAISYIFREIHCCANPKFADVGAGTGLLTELLLAEQVPVVAVEPNSAMRLEADRRLSYIDAYSSVDGSAENTRLEENSVDVVTAAQAFHWFNLTKARKEFTRILRPSGNIVLIWNRRDSSESEFMLRYESLLQSRIPEYSKVNHSIASDAVIEEFLGRGMKKAVFEYHQVFDLEGLKGRLLSSSYAPAKGKKGHEQLMSAMELLYHAHATDRGIQFNYQTQIYHAKVG